MHYVITLFKTPLELLQNKNNFKITETISKIIRLFLKKLFKNQTKIKTLFQIYLKSKIILKAKTLIDQMNK